MKNSLSLFFKDNYKLLLILLVSLFLSLLNNGSIIITDPVESNYALTAKEMLASHDYLSPKIYGNFWYDKPIFYYWELIASFKVLGISNFAARLPSTIFSLANLILIYAFTKKVLNKKLALLTTAAIAMSFEFWFLSKTIITDMTLFLFFNATLMCFYLGYHSSTDKKKYFYWGTYIFSALAVLTKGPIGLLLPGLIILLYLLIQKNIKELLHIKLITGFILFFIIAGSWYVYMYDFHGQIFIDTFLGVHNWLRATVSEHPRWNVPYYYLVITILATCPWSFIFLYRLGKNRHAIKNFFKTTRIKEIYKVPYLQDSLNQFLLLWALCVIVFFQCMATKYTTYTFPALFPLILLLCKDILLNLSTVKKASVIMTIGYTLLTLLLLPNLTRGGSGLDVAQYIDNNLTDNDMVVSYGLYHTSADFYGTHKIYNVIDDDKFEAAQPNGRDWNSKNVMPLLRMSDIPKNEKVYLIIDVNTEEKEKTIDLTKWTLVDKTVNSYIYTN